MPPGRSESPTSGAPARGGPLGEDHLVHGSDARFGPVIPVIGLEIHVQLATRTKMFCRCAYRYGAPANTRTCPVCLGYPGALPVPNRRAVDLAVTLALALGATVHERSAFDRKSYVYPDLPKGYQITQLDHPLATGGAIPLAPAATPVPARADGPGDAAPRPPRTIGLARLHLEEDAGKLIHDPGPPHGASDEPATLIDFNRCGVPLVEIVTRPELRSPEEARELLRTLRHLLRWLGVSDGSMEEGSLRCDANLSLRPRGGPSSPAGLGTKVEVKNLNSFRHVAQALAYEAARQAEVLADGGQVVAETRGFDAATGTTHPLRDKEASADYRYFPEPDLPPLEVSADRRAALAAALPELPWRRRARLVAAHGLPLADAVVLTESRALADYLERALGTEPAAPRETGERGHRPGESPGDATGSRPRAIAAWLRSEVLGRLGQPPEALEGLLPARHLAALVDLVLGGRVSHSAAKEVLAATWGADEAPAAALTRLELERVDDPARLGTWVEEVLAAHPDKVARYLDGKTGLAEFFVGRVMARSAGRAEPHRVRELLDRALDARRTEPALSH